MCRHSGPRAVAHRKRHGTHASRDVATREDAAHGGLLRLVGFEERAERALVKHAAERLGERESGPRTGLQEETLKPQLTSVLEANVDHRCRGRGDEPAQRADRPPVARRAARKERLLVQPSAS